MLKRTVSLAIKKIKLWVKQVIYAKLDSPPDLQATYSLFEPSEIIERSLMLGDKSVLVKSLDMQSAPGTTEMIVHLLSPEHRDVKVLDYGCGNHRSKYLKKMGFRVTSCDIYDATFDNYVKINPAEPRLPFPDKAFDIAVISEVIEHVENPWAILLELKRVTKRKIIATTPNVVSKKSKTLFVKTNYFYWFTPDIDYHITPVFYWQMENFCQRHGMKLQATFGNHQVYFPESTSILDDAETLIFEVVL